MYRSAKKIESKGLAVLRKDLDVYLRGHDFIYAKSLKRKVFLSKLPDAILMRKKTLKKRLQCFIVACDIVRHADTNEMRLNAKKEKEYSIEGMSACGRSVGVHLREEFVGKDKKLFFVSCFFNEK
jgi:hypothetical protein